MKLNWINEQNSVARSVALGIFDGVHRGHQKLLEKAIRGKPAGGTSSVLTFDFPPEEPFENRGRFLTSFSRRAELIRDYGIDEIAWLPFTNEFFSLEAGEFVETFLIKTLKAVQVVCGFNFRFGKGRSGDAEYLKKLGSRRGFQVTVVQPVLGRGTEVISSTVIRGLLAAGAIEQAAEYLGYFPAYNGQVVRGAGRGRGLGFPTANLLVDAALVLPGEGVYLTWAVLPGGLGAPALTSIGRNPTFDGNVQTIETFIMDFDADLYSKNLQVQFLRRLRDIVRYNTREELQSQISADVALGRQMLQGFRLQDSRIVLE